MIPTLVHRYTFPIRHAIEALLGEDAGDAEAWLIRVEGGEVVVDIVIGEIATATAEVVDIEDARQQRASNEVAEINTEAPAEPPRKGGRFARQAGIIGGEKGFWTFVGKKYGATITSADEAAAWLKATCNVESRIDFDYEDVPAAHFREIDSAYGLWLEGYDV